MKRTLRRLSHVMSANTTFEVLACKLAYYSQGDVFRARHAIFMRDEPKRPCLRWTLQTRVVA